MRTFEGLPDESIQRETAAIVAAIGDATAALTNWDFDAYANSWVHAPYVRRMGGWSHGENNWSQGGLFVQEGWDGIWPTARGFCEERTYSVYPHGTQCQNWNVRVGGDMAWATYDQYPLDATGRAAPGAFGFLREARMLEKQGGQWKFSYLSFFHELPAPGEQALVRVDHDAVIVSISQTAAELIGKSETLRVRNGRLRAVDRDSDARLRATIREIACANPWMIGAIQVPFLVRTPWDSADCICWIASSLDMKANAVISIGDARAARRRLQNAIRVYRLSSAQARLAEQIVDGRDLATAAVRLGVTVNTARTHLRRMFEKTGVRTQPALVGALLSVSAPLD